MKINITEKATFYAWLAGFIDADGAIGAYLGTRTSSDVRVSITSISHETLCLIKNTLNIGRLQTIKARGPGRSDYYTWTASCNQAIFVLKDILPYMVTKKRQAKIAICLQNRIAKRTGIKKNRLSSKEKLTRARLTRKLRNLKK